MPISRARVVCALGVTIATFWPTSALTSVDLPALGAPITATNPASWLPRSLQLRQQRRRRSGFRFLLAGPFGGGFAKLGTVTRTVNWGA